MTVVTPQAAERGCRGAEILHVPAPAYLGVGADPGGDAAASRWHGLGQACKHAVKGAIFIPDTFVYWSLRAARLAARACRDRPPDLVLTSSPQESSHWIGWQLQKRFGCRWLADFRDGWTFEPHRPEALLPLRRTIERRLERAVLERADWITAATRPIAEDFQRRFPAAAIAFASSPAASRKSPWRPQRRTTACSGSSTRADSASRTRRGRRAFFLPAWGRPFPPASPCAANSASSWWAICRRRNRRC